MPEGVAIRGEEAAFCFAARDWRLGERFAAEFGGHLESSPAENRRHDVDQPHASLDHRRLRGGEPVYDERHLEGSPVKAELVAHQSSFTEELTVIGGRDDDQLVGIPFFAEKIDDRARSLVRRCDVSEIETALNCNAFGGGKPST